MSLGRSAGSGPGDQPGWTGVSAGWRSEREFSQKARSGEKPSVVLGWARRTLDDLVATLFPSECRVCNGPLLRAGMLPVCHRCLEQVAPQTGVLCRICGEAIGVENERFLESYGTEARVCTPCRRVPPAFTRAIAFGEYGKEMRELIHLLKYDRVRRLAGPLGEMLAAAMEQLEPGAGENRELLVIAVPLFRSRKRDRGFNHAELLAEGALRVLRRRHPGWRLRARHHLLERIRATESQFGLTPHGRRANVRGAFAVSEKSKAALAGRDVLLIDDIYTTGATARSCAQVLRGAGAKSVCVATVARAQVEDVAMWDGGANKVTEFEAATGGHR